MRRLIILLISCWLVSGQEEQYKYDTKYIDMPLDHFNFNTNKTFKLRYLVNDSYYAENKPIYFYTGNEGTITNFAQNTGFMFDLAKKNGALLVFAEHRYYGETLPFGNDSFNSKNIGFLSAQQALADFVYLIDYLQTEYRNSSSLPKIPVIAFGGSYGGMLSAWLRMKYPYSVDGAIASSAPIWQFKGLTKCQNFYKIVTDVFKTVGSAKCVETITNFWSIIRNQSSTDKGKSNISETFNLCQPLNSTDDVDNFLNWISNIYVNTVMVDYPYPTSFLAPLPAYPVKVVCQEMDSHDYSDDQGLVQTIAKGLEVYTNYTKATKCNDIQTTSGNLGEAGWDFQSCTDMVMPMCSINGDMFENVEWNFEKVSDDCFKRFGVRPRNEKVPILEFGGKDLETASNIVFSNGLMDPWSSGGVVQNVTAGTVSILIPDGAHHYDLRAANDLDTASVKTARLFHEEQITKWVDQVYFDYFSKVSREYPEVLVRV